MWELDHRQAVAFEFEGRSLEPPGIEDDLGDLEPVGQVANPRGDLQDGLVTLEDLDPDPQVFGDVGDRLRRTSSAIPTSRR